MPKPTGRSKATLIVSGLFSFLVASFIPMVFEIIMKSAMTIERAAPPGYYWSAGLVTFVFIIIGVVCFAIAAGEIEF